MIGLLKTYVANIMGILIIRNTLNHYFINFQLIIFNFQFSNGLRMIESGCRLKFISIIILLRNDKNKSVNTFSFWYLSLF